MLERMPEDHRVVFGGLDFDRLECPAKHIESLCLGLRASCG